MGVKGSNSKIKSNSFDDTDKFWTMSNHAAYYMKVEERAYLPAQKSLLS